MTISVNSPDITEGGPIPTRYTCDGEDVSPPLRWSGIPLDTAALALVVDDPDAPRGTFTHWVVVDIDPAVTSLARGQSPRGAQQIVNSAGRASYMGPCPPSGVHRYRFTVYALSSAVTRGALGRMVVQKADGASVHEDTPLSTALQAAGFAVTPRGLRIRG